MAKQTELVTVSVCFLVLFTACSPNDASLNPKEVIDLGALVTEDLPEQVWGKGFLAEMGFTRPNAFEVIDYTKRVVADPVKYCATDLVQPGSPRQKLALLLLEYAYWLFPGYIWVLCKPAEACKIGTDY